MRQGKIFAKTRRDAPKDETSKSAQLLIKAGFIYKELAGVYTLLPYGLRVMNKIENIIRDEMNSLGASELNMTALQDPEIWKKTNRWNDAEVENWFKTKLKNETELGLAFTHEEPITNLMREHINSYKDLPVYAYQFQTKFRNELRAKSGIMRGREFLMKDLYSFSLNETQHNEFYEKAKQAYLNVFKKVGLGEITHVTFASGGVFSKFSHEFQTVCDVGEDLIYLDQKSGTAINKEVLNDEVLADLGIVEADLIEKKSIEVGNIFTLGTKFSEPLELVVDNPEGPRTTVFMGSYGIGLGRVMGTVAEIFADESGLRWPISIAPFQVHILNLSIDDVDCTKRANEIHEALRLAGVDTMIDDRDVSSGVKLNDSDLIGIPYRIIVGKKSMSISSENVMYKRRANQSKFDITEETEIKLWDLIQMIRDEKI